MLKSFRKHPRLCVAQVFAFLIALPAFFSTVSFSSALTPGQAIAEYNKPLPPGWTAGVMNHGGYYRWWTIQQRPVLFGASVIFLAVGMLFIYGSLFWVWKQNEKSHAINGLPAD
ncbi:MAG TPA: hypothetical protein VKV04_02005 [Verrucomicrobiae bacterium]|nr:hypothetical protein [Verrucomicrobiae bacterium]